MQQCRYPTLWLQKIQYRTIHPECQCTWSNNSVNVKRLRRYPVHLQQISFWRVRRPIVNLHDLLLFSRALGEYCYCRNYAGRPFIPVFVSYHPGDKSHSFYFRSCKSSSIIKLRLIQIEWSKLWQCLSCSLCSPMQFAVRSIKMLELIKDVLRCPPENLNNVWQLDPSLSKKHQLSETFGDQIQANPIPPTPWCPEK